jgi:hypothetical protein
MASRAGEQDRQYLEAVSEFGPALDRLARGCEADAEPSSADVSFSSRHWLTAVSDIAGPAGFEHPARTKAMTAVERSVRNPTLTVLEKLALALGSTIGELADTAPEGG